MSYHSKRKAKNEATLNENKPIKDFNACYNDFFNPMMKEIRYAVEANTHDANLLNKAYLDAVKFMSMTNDTSKKILNEVLNHYKSDDVNFSKIIINSKESIFDLFKQVHNAKIGFGYCNEVINGSNKKKNSKDLIKKCNEDEGIANFDGLRKDLCENAVELLTRVTDGYNTEVGISSTILDLPNDYANKWDNPSTQLLSGSTGESSNEIME